MSALPLRRAAWLVVRIRLLRLINRVRSRRAFGRKSQRQTRVGTAGKEGGSVWVGFIGLALVAMAFNTAHGLLRNIEAAYPTLAAGQRPEAALAYLTTISLMAAVAALLLGLANKELATPEWDLEWLVTLPTPLRTVLLVRVLERALVNPLGVVAFVALLTTVAVREGHGWTSPLWGILATLPVLAFIGALQTLVDTGWRLRLSAPRVRNLQAFLTVAGTLSFYVIYASGMTERLPFAWPARAPAWVQWAPPALAVRAVLAGAPFRTLLLLFLESAAVVGITVVWLERILAGGVVAAGARESVRGARHTEPRLRAEASMAGAPEQLAEGTGRGRWRLSPVIRRELRLLGRDRAFQMQTLVMPIVLAGFQLFMSTSARKGGLSFATLAPNHVGAIAFGVAAYTLMFSAFQTLNTEGQALWILYTLPQSVTRVLADKAKLWGGVAIAYALAVLGAAVATRGRVPVEGLFTWVIALAGVPIYAVIGTSLGVFAARPLAQEAQRRVAPSLTTLFMLMVSLYTYAIYATSLWQRAALLAITSLLAAALWQKARDRIPFLLDPAAVPPPEVSLADGMMAALVFFVLQGLIGMAMVAAKKPFDARTIAIAFVGAGALSAGGTRLVHALVHARGVPRVWGPAGSRAIRNGVAGGAVAALIGLTYLTVMARLQLRFPGLRPSLEQSPLQLAHAGPWIAILAVVAAPLFEEFIFRGLVFGGLRRTFGFPASALASAAVFAVVHPPFAAVPVFLLALIAASVYERSKLLVAPMLTHAIYNAVIVGVAFLR